jgi:splicing factor 3A subunit 3
VGGGAAEWDAANRAGAPPATPTADAATSETTAVYCDACQRSFAKQSVYDGHLGGKKHQRAVLAQQAGTPTAAVPQHAHTQEVARMEALVTGYAAILADVLAATKANVERRQTLTEEERRAEAEQDAFELDEAAAAAQGDGASESEDEERLYNPLNIPLDFDGKPIPYWLFKLHGLGIKFPCEICGGYVYMGRKAFEQHFQEPRHTHGMRCLGIPNTKAFHDITSIADARALWAKMQADEKRMVVAGDAVEFEDAEGNVYNRKTYEDLKRQGLI